MKDDILLFPTSNAVATARRAHSLRAYTYPEEPRWQDSSAHSHADVLSHGGVPAWIGKRRSLRMELCGTDGSGFRCALRFRRRPDPMTWKKIFAVVTLSALSGMVMGGLFGLAAGRLTPDFFRHLIPWQDVEPVGMATLLGATAGVLLGGALGCFGVVVQTALHWKNRGTLGG